MLVNSVVDNTIRAFAKDFGQLETSSVGVDGFAKAGRG